jgi:hypothetical protein
MESLLYKGRIICCFLFLCSFCFAKDYRDTALWLELFSPKAAAMGEIPLADDPLSALWNPTGLLELKGDKLSFLYKQSPLSIGTYAFAWDRNSLSIGALSWGSSQIAFDSFGNSLGDAKVEGRALFLGKALRLHRNLSCGISLLVCDQDLAGKFDRGGSISLALAGNWGQWKLGLGARDIIGKLGEDPLETKVGLLVTYHLEELTVAAQWQRQHLHLGGEYAASPNVRLRLGGILGDTPNYFWGIGLVQSGWQFDFAWRLHSHLPREFTAGGGYLF